MSNFVAALDDFCVFGRGGQAIGPVVGFEFLSKSPSKIRRDAERFRVFRRLGNGDVVAVKPVNPHRRVTRDVNMRVLWVEHVSACDAGAVVHDPRGKGVYDREPWPHSEKLQLHLRAFQRVSFKSAFFEM